MNQFDTVENMDAYCELANAIVASACDDYRHYNKHFCKNLDLMQYITDRLGEIKNGGEEYSGEWNNLKLVKDDTELDQRKLKSKIAEIEKFLPSHYGMILSHGLGEVILEKIKKEQPVVEPSAERGRALFKKKEKQMQKRLEKLLERRKNEQLRP